MNYVIDDRIIRNLNSQNLYKPTYLKLKED